MALSVYVQLESLINVAIVGEATSNAVHWRNIKNAAIITCRPWDCTVVYIQVKENPFHENKCFS